MASADLEVGWIPEAVRSGKSIALGLDSWFQWNPFFTSYVALVSPELLSLLLERRDPVYSKDYEKRSRQ